MNDVAGSIEKFFARGNSYWLTRFVILRLLGFVYAIAFLVAARQLVPLIGHRGLTPADFYLSSIHTEFGSRTEGMLHLPTLFWGCTCQSFTSARFGTATDGRSNCSRLGSCRSFFVRCLMEGHFRILGRRFWSSGSSAGSPFESWSARV